MWQVVGGISKGVWTFDGGLWGDRKCSLLQTLRYNEEDITHPVSLSLLQTKGDHSAFQL